MPASQKGGKPKRDKPPVDPLYGSLIAHWPMDEGGGSLLVDTIGRRDARFTGATVWGVSSDPRVGGPMIVLDGVTASTGATAGAGKIAAGLNGCSVLAWASTSVTAGLQQAAGRAIYCERAATGNDIFKLDSFDNTTNAMFFTWRNDAGNLSQIRTTGTNIADLRPHQLVVTINGLDVSLYVDGTQNVTGTINASNTFTDAIIIDMGYDEAATTALWKGNIHLIQIYKKTLSGSEVYALYNDPFLPFRQKSYRKLWFLGGAAAAQGGGLPKAIINNPLTF